MEKKTLRLEIPVSHEEYTKIKSKADRIGMKLASFCRLLLSNSEIKIIEINNEKKK